MSSFWVIIRSDERSPEDKKETNNDNIIETPIVCGLYNTKEEAVEEILKLYIEDDIDLVYKQETASLLGPVQEPFDFRPTVENIKEQRKLLLADETWYTYTHRGNKYTLNECVMGAKHEFDPDIMELYNQSN